MLHAARIALSIASRKGKSRSAPRGGPSMRILGQQWVGRRLRPTILFVATGLLATAALGNAEPPSPRQPAPEERMLTVTSPDGTRIAFWRSGAGPALLLVHGATADHTTTWRLVRPELEKRFTVYAMDRRGRGGSGDASRYDLQREAEDVAAVVDAIGGPVDVLGHSFGALCALEAARRTRNVRRLVLYEGVPLRGAESYPAAAVERLEELAAAGDLEGTLVALYRDVAGMTAEEVSLLRSQTVAWSARLRNARVAPRELRAERDYVFDAARYRGMRAPALLLVGGASPARDRASAEGVAAALPAGRVAVLPGQQHIAHYTAPDLFVQAVQSFLLAPDG
jgi:pimeloyl-ACP methyl ester carboxylesterase